MQSGHIPMPEGKGLFRTVDAPPRREGCVAPILRGHFALHGARWKRAIRQNVPQEYHRCTSAGATLEAAIFSVIQDFRYAYRSNKSVYSAYSLATALCAWLRSEPPARGSAKDPE